MLCQLSYPGITNREVSASIIAITRRWTVTSEYLTVAQPYWYFDLRKSPEGRAGAA